MINRIVRRLSGTPRIRVRLRPTSGYGASDPEITHGSNHIRYVGETATIRLTTDAPPSYILEETPFSSMNRFRSCLARMNPSPVRRRRRRRNSMIAPAIIGATGSANWRCHWSGKMP